MDIQELQLIEPELKQYFYRKKLAYKEFLVDVCNAGNDAPKCIDFILQTKTLKNYKDKIVFELYNNFVFDHKKINDSYISRPVFDCLLRNNVWNRLITYTKQDNQNLLYNEMKNIVREDCTELMLTVFDRKAFDVFQRVLEVFDAKYMLSLTTKIDYETLEVPVLAYAKLKLLDYGLSHQACDCSFEDLDKMLYVAAKNFMNVPESIEKIRLLLKYGADYEFGLQRFAKMYDVFSIDSLRSSFEANLQIQGSSQYVLGRDLRKKHPSLQPKDIYSILKHEDLVEVLSRDPSYSIQNILNYAKSRKTKLYQFNI